jgi:hypothetical protein
VNLPISLGVAMLALFLGVNGIWLAGRLFWHRQRSMFWLASSIILAGVAYLILTGLAEDVARGLWPVAFDPTKGKEYMLRAPCERLRGLGFMIIVAPIVLVLVPILLLSYRSRPRFVSLTTVLFGVSAFLLYVSPMSEKLARLILPEDMLRVPSHCGSATL